MRANKSGALPVRLLMVSLFFLLVGLGFCIASMFAVKYFGVQNQIVVALMVESNIRPCFDDPSSVAAWVKPLSYSLHNMNDSELFWRASFVPRIKAYPFKRFRKIAFMFLTKGPLPLAPLWERFFKGHEGIIPSIFTVILLMLPTFHHLLFLTGLQSVSVSSFEGSVRTVNTISYSEEKMLRAKHLPMLFLIVIDSGYSVDVTYTIAQVAEWGTMSMCDVERRLLANAQLDISNEWFNLLSESCIPLRNFSVTYLYLSRSRYSFMGSFDEPGSYGRGRYNWNMASEVNLTEWRKGSQWFEVADTLYYPKFKEFCRPACYVEEHYFPTMLSTKSPHLLANRSLTYVDWSRGGAHPATIGRADITEDFFREISKGSTCIYNDQPSSLCSLFARKFSPSALEPLLNLTSNVFGF